MSSRQLSTSPRRPFKHPYEPVAVSLDENGKFVYTPVLARRLVLPADYGNNKLRDWNQKKAPVKGCPWKISDYDKASGGKIALTMINSGTSVVFHQPSGYQEKTGQINPLGRIVFNWALDKAANKFSFEFYLDNDLEETDPTVIYDDDETFWELSQDTAGSYQVTHSEETTEKVKGTSSLKMVVSAGSFKNCGCKKEYGSSQDWSSKEFLCLYIYGANTGLTLAIYIHTDATNYFRWYLTDNWSGWKRIILPFKGFEEQGSPDWSDINIFNISYRNINQTFTSYLDRTVVDVGQWAKVEVYMPDVLGWGAGEEGWVHSWTGTEWTSGYNFLSHWGANNKFFSYATDLYFLDGQTAHEIYPDIQQGAYYREGCAGYQHGERGDTKSPDPNTDPNAEDLTYSSYYGCLNRLGFAIKMPPDDGQDASDDGISQCKLQVEVPYAAVFSRYLNKNLDGLTTYVFEESTNQYYGLQNWNERWLALFDETTKTVEFLIFSERPTSLKVRADEDELIDMIELGLPAGARVWLGEIVHRDLTADADSDGVPDFIEDFIQQVMPKKGW